MHKTTTRTGQLAYVSTEGFILKALRKGEGYRVQLAQGSFSWAPTLKAASESLAYLASPEFAADEAERINDAATYSEGVRLCVLHPLSELA